MKISIMHVVNSFDLGGMENGIVNLINHMDNSRLTHYVCCIRNSGMSAEKIKDKNIRIYEMNKSEGNSIALPFKLAHLFSREHIDIVHTRNWGAVDGIIGAKLARIPHVIHGEHGRDMLDPDGTNRKRNFIRKGFSYFVDKFVTVSMELRNWMINDVGINGMKVQAICNGVDTDKFNPGDKERYSTLQNFDRADIVIGTVGRLDPVKDQHLLIKAFSRLSKKYNNIELLVIGDGPCREQLEKDITHMDLGKKVHLVGMRMDVPALLKRMDIFILPSLREGISNTILEAMATGIPVIASSVGGNTELVLNDETGYLFPVGDMNALIKAIERYILNRETMKWHGAAARQRAVSQFSLQKMINDYEKLYTGLMVDKTGTV